MKNEHDLIKDYIEALDRLDKAKSALEVSVQGQLDNKISMTYCGYPGNSLSVWKIETQGLMTSHLLRLLRDKLNELFPASVTDDAEDYEHERAYLKRMTE